MINYFNFTEFNDSHLLLTNDFGAYSFVTKSELKQMLDGTLAEDSLLSEELKRNGFILPNQTNEIIADTKYRLRDAKSYLLSGTSLQIFVLTNDCNLNCIYCQARNHNSGSYSKMTIETARRAVDIALESPSRYLDFEFQGGEPLTNFEVLKFIVEYSEVNHGKHEITYSVVTNLSLLTEKMLDFFAEHNVRISTSLDGPSELHNKNRPFINGNGSYDILMNAIARVKNRNIPLGAIQTTTKHSLSHPEEIIDEYIKLGFKTVFIRPLTKLGTAYSNWDSIGYTAEEFLEFYRKCFKHILDKNLEDVDFSEGHSALFLSKIFRGISPNYMELRSPCGAGIGQMAYYIDGNIYTCDEGRMLSEMGDAAFKLGNVWDNNYSDLVSSSVCKTVCSVSTLESLPGCCDCVFQPYCGVCPVVNYAVDKSLYSRNYKAYRCSIYQGMLKNLFDYLYDNDSQIIDCLKRW